MKKLACLGLSLTMTLGLLSACGGGAETTPTPAPAESTAPVESSAPEKTYSGKVMMYSSMQEDQLMAIKEGFEKKYPGITMEYVRELVGYAHSLGALTITAIGTSQEGSDKDTIRQIALWCKMTGTDIHHIGDSGYVGMALPENIMTYSIAIRGIRHTYHRMAQSINR